MLSIKQFTFNAFQENTYLLYDETKSAVIIDPGCSNSSEERELLNFIEQEELSLEHLINTHCHVDHVLGLNFIADKFNLPAQFHALDLQVLEAVPNYATMYGFNVMPFSGEKKFIAEGDKITFGKTTLDVLFVPGHAPGHVVFVYHPEKIVIGGDVLFYGSIGRTDLPGGDHETLITSIKSKLFPLGDDYVVYPGHGPKTNIGFEKKNNPFLN